MERRRRIAGYVMALGLLVGTGMYAMASVRYWKSTQRLTALEHQCSQIAAKRPKIVSINPSDVDAPVAPSEEWDTRTWALVIALVLSIPRVWYFLLGRLAELSAAIRRP